jgi:hypothetical protein
MMALPSMSITPCRSFGEASAFMKLTSGPLYWNVLVAIRKTGWISCLSPMYLPANYDEITHHKHDAVSIFYDLDAAAMIQVQTLDLGTAVLVVAVGSWLDRR